MNGSYDLMLVLVSYLVATLASYTALDLAGRITASTGNRANQWLLGGSVAMGTGIWAMHFTGMMAFELPIIVTYSPWLTLLSWVAAIIVSMLALWAVSRARLGYRTIVWGALLMGTGICVMHYTGMAAMQIAPGIDYEPIRFIASALIAVSASAVALVIAFRLRSHDSQRFSKPRLAAALVMGFAIVGMHYTGMAAAQFSAQTVCATQSGLSGNWGGLPLASVTAVILMGTLMLSRNDAQAAVRAARQRRQQEDAERLYQLTYADAETQLPNRTLLKETLLHLTTGEGAIRQRFVLALVEINGCDHLLNRLGRQQERALVQACALRLREATSKDDLLVRWGQHAFAVLSQTTPDAAQLNTRLQSTLKAPIEVAGQTITLDVAIQSCSHPEDGLSPHVLLSKLRHPHQHTAPEDHAPLHGRPLTGGLAG
ncbi:MHYT domain-containing protein [Jeongeupia naejangsanensis]|uniref:Diguanylate cyclase n=1 Tax=Jeongeupia naejangsanensis TaxID=613195 RepID=A0ABS2BGG0_9NEIS|nr:MHYT domain-containing protein [Jeongeupia naejangsanensis]MBM3114691.1 diguanylate cyclase [Jeongeupia naejangsanensis]